MISRYNLSKNKEKIMEYKKYPERELSSVLSIPFIWGMLIFFIIFDIGLEIYHQIGFRIFHFPCIFRCTRTEPRITIPDPKIKFIIVCI